MSAKVSLLRSLVKLLELILPEEASAAAPAAGKRPLDVTMHTAVRVVQRWADVNRVPLPRAWVVASAERCPPSYQIHSEIHWAIKTLFIRVRDDHAAQLDEQYRFKLELAIATASRAWYLIEERDEDDEFDSANVVSEYAGMFLPASG